MEDEYTIQIDNALAMLAERINTIETNIDGLRNIDIPSDIIEMYAKTKVVDKYIGMGFSRYEALQLTNIEVPENMPEQTVEASEVVEGYQTTMRSLQSSIEALKAVFDYSESDYEKSMAENITDQTDESNQSREENSQGSTTEEQRNTEESVSTDSTETD